uniref:Uncharacterized protein n=1 Tax=Rhizophora mucronata TaxID=61149 RepID=A0A2P2PXZ1_RHIMU
MDNRYHHTTVFGLYNAKKRSASNRDMT